MKYRRAAAIILTIAGFFLPVFMITKVSLNLPIVLGGAIIYALYFYLVGRLYGLDEKGNLPMPPTNAASTSSPTISCPSCDAPPSAIAAAEADAPACTASPAAPTVSCPSCDAPTCIKAAEEAAAPACTVPVTPEQAAAILRQKIIASLQRQPSTTYELAGLLWDDAKDCIKDMYGYSGHSACPYDGIWFYLDLNTHKINAKMASYPNAFGASRENEESLSADSFHHLAVKYHLNPEVLHFRTAEDWEELFNDDSLKAAIAEVNLAAQKQAEAERQRNAIQIPARYAKRKAKMDVEAIDYTLMQRYAVTHIQVTIKDGGYHGIYENRSTMSPQYHRHVFSLTGPDAVWLEEQVVDALEDPDFSTWQSLPGGDRMELVIRRKHGMRGAKHSGMPITKYTDLMGVIAKMAQYSYILK